MDQKCELFIKRGWTILLLFLFSILFLIVILNRRICAKDIRVTLKGATLKDSDKLLHLKSGPTPIMGELK